MCDQQRLRPACAYEQCDQSLCWSLEYSMTVKLLTEPHLGFLSLNGGCTGSCESTLVTIPQCWKSHYSELETKPCRNIPQCTKTFIGVTLHQVRRKLNYRTAKNKFVGSWYKLKGVTLHQVWWQLIYRTTTNKIGGSWDKKV